MESLEASLGQAFYMYEFIRTETDKEETIIIEMVMAELRKQYATISEDDQEIIEEILTFKYCTKLGV
ncbi:hypothetical protein KAU11_09170 [Candidatus Babeliales bacterium]|nr:hypothetical protein [Candidatus Babeliales bacterium]